MSKDEKWWHAEELFLDQDRKEGRKERKIASTKDRSKFKKSNQDQLKKQKEALASSSENSPKGRVLAITPEGVLVAFGAEELLCQLRGSLKQEKNAKKNLLAVGDFVHVDKHKEGFSSITSIEKRTSILSRADNLSRNKEQLIAVNIDQVLITASVVLPSLKPSLIDRYIIAAQKGNMTPIILINKIDLLPQATQEEKDLYALFLKTYRSLGVCVIAISCESQEGLSELKEVMKGKASVFSGQSGVGKSSLINWVTDSSLLTGSIVHKTKKGSHTTTTTHLIPLEGEGFCIDTPGIKSFGVWDLQIEEVAHYFTEIFTASEHCKYSNCSHLNEPECAVKKAVEEGMISPLRFASYLAILGSIKEKHTQR
jgi:ribosome biogenesis GTPase